MTSASINQSKDPNTAAMMSIIPGLGQMYNGESRKGMLFLLVAALNVVLFIGMAFNIPILEALLSFGANFHMKPNKMLLIVLREAYLGSPVSLILLLFFVSFVIYAVRDAYDHAAMKRRRIYPDFVIELPEATSGSYIFHFSIMVALFIVAFFFVIPPMPKSQLTEIEFVDNQPKQKQLQKVQRKSRHDSVNSGKHEPKKPVQAPQNAGQKAQQPQQHKAQEKQAPAASAPKAPAPSPQPHAAPPTPHQAPTPPAPHPSPSPSPAPPTPRAPSPMPVMPRMSTPSPAAPSPSPMRAPSPSPTAMPRMAPSPMAMPSATPMPMAAAPKSFSPSAVPAIAPSALPRAGTGAAMPMPTARPSGGGATGLPTLAPTPIAMGSGGAGGGMSNFAPLARSGGSQGGGSWSGPTAPGPVAASSGGGGGGKSGGGGGGPVPVAMSSGGGGGGHGSSGGSSGPAPVRAGRGGGGNGGNGWSSGPISISPSVPRGGSGGDGASGNPDANNNPGGKPSVAANADVDFGPYMADLQRRIKRAWFPPRGQESRRVVVIFKVHSGGELSDLRIDKSSGVATADQAALEAVRNAAPFRPLPNGAPSVVDIQFTFDYNVFSGGRGF